MSSILTFQMSGMPIYVVLMTKDLVTIIMIQCMIDEVIVKVDKKVLMRSTYLHK